MDPLTRLARQAGEGDRRALDTFIAATYDMVWRYCGSMAGRQRADDLAQEVFVQVVRALPGFRGRSSARTWLLAIARHVCLDGYRRGGRRTPDVPLGEAEHAAAPGDPGEQVAVELLVDRLDPERRDAFVLTRVLGLTYAEASAVCGCPVGTIRSRVARARADLVAMMDGAEAPGRTARTGRSRPA